MRVTSSFSRNFFVCKRTAVLVARCVVLAFLCVSFGFFGVADAQSYASSERSAAALGHYARARAMLIEALAEFEEGKRLANPDLLIDSEQWRLTVVSRAEELNRVLDPKPKVTRSGVRYKAHKRFIRHDPFYRHRNVGPKVSNTYWESEFQNKKKQPVRGRLIEEAYSDKGAVVEKKSVAKASVQRPLSGGSVGRGRKTPSTRVPSYDESNNLDEKVVDSVVDEVVTDKPSLVKQTKEVPPAAKSAQEVEEEIDTIVQNFGSEGVEEDPELLQAIQDVVQSRLDDMDGEFSNDN